MRFSLTIEASPDEWLPTVALIRDGLAQIVAASDLTAGPPPPGDRVGDPGMTVEAPHEPTAEERYLALGGAVAFAGLVETWSEGFGIDGAPQPDRISALRETMAAHGIAIISFIRLSGGLVSAVQSVLGRPCGEYPVGGHDGEGTVAENELRYARAIAGNIAQIGSLVCPPIADTLNYTVRAKIGAGV